ncbi:MAG: efflux RND transporter periplasmic adaptor subunit [Dehalococcoidia bacterium]|nr:efflux RND transporter periplasmic adaptor subunit [Dehalococcoidia bacterium]
MGVLVDALKTIRLWQIGVLVTVLAGAAGAIYGGYALVGGSGSTGASANQQLIPVVFGNVVNQVSTSGSLVFANRATLTFGTQGTVGVVLVTEGQEVKEGQPLASLDAAAVASLEKAVAQARVNLRNAEDALAKTKVPYTPDDVAKAQSQVDSAKTSLSNAAIDLKLAQKDWDAKVKAARDALATATEGYQRVYARWLGIAITEAEANRAPDVLLSSWGVDLGALFNPNRRFTGLRGEFPPDDPATPWSEPLVYVWLTLYPGEIAPTCADGIVPSRGFCVMKEMDDAWDPYQKAQDNLDTVETQAKKAIASAESALARAKDSLATAGKVLVDLQAAPDPLDVALKEAELVSARVALDQATQRREGATLMAPMTGIVSLVNVSAGQAVNANTTIVEVVDPTVVEVNGVVDEVDVLFVRVGAKADVTMDALRGQVLHGTVSSIASAAQTQQGVVSYPIRIHLQAPAGVQLQEGLSATATIVIQEENNVLRVPLQALYGTFDKPTVKVMNSGRVEERSVVLGNSDDYWVAVRQGLAEGEQVVMEAQKATAGQLGAGQAFRQFQGQLQGGFTGGGGFRDGGQGGQRAQPTPRSGR